MPYQEVLIMAVTRMLSGACIAGFSTERHLMSHLCWVRPVKEHDTLLLGDSHIRTSASCSRETS